MSAFRIASEACGRASLRHLQKKRMPRRCSLTPRRRGSFFFVAALPPHCIDAPIATHCCPLSSRSTLRIIDIRCSRMWIQLSTYIIDSPGDMIRASSDMDSQELADPDSVSNPLAELTFGP